MYRGLPETDLCLREALVPLTPLFPADFCTCLFFASWVRQPGSLGSERHVWQEGGKAAGGAAPRSAVGSGACCRYNPGGDWGSPEPKEHPQDRGCAELHGQLSDQQTSSPESFKTAITKDDVPLVLLLIRWSSHVLSAVDTFCWEHGKHLVHVPTGFDAKRLEQPGTRLQRGSDRAQP